jgi:hypothetical protein
VNVMVLADVFQPPTSYEVSFTSLEDRNVAGMKSSTLVSNSSLSEVHGRSFWTFRIPDQNEGRSPSVLHERPRAVYAVGRNTE